jgi:hypothetical protein
MRPYVAVTLVFKYSVVPVAEQVSGVPLLGSAHNSQPILSRPREAAITVS